MYQWPLSFTIRNAQQDLHSGRLSILCSRTKLPLLQIAYNAVEVLDHLFAGLNEPLESSGDGHKAMDKCIMRACAESESNTYRAARSA